MMSSHTSESEMITLDLSREEVDDHPTEEIHAPVQAEAVREKNDKVMFNEDTNPALLTGFYPGECQRCRDWGCRVEWWDASKDYS